MTDETFEPTSPARRPRFLVRRSTGKLGVTMKIEGKEIIARR